MKTNPRRGKAAFTLIEILVVMAIIVILAGLVVGGSGFVKEKQKRTAAQLQIEILSRAIGEYKLEMGTFPGTAEDTPVDGDKVTNELYTALFYDGYDRAQNPEAEQTANSTKSTKIYLADLDPTSTKQKWFDPTSGEVPATLVIKDPWKNEYRYRKGVNAINPDFDLWSCGPDGKTNTRETPEDRKAKILADDVSNFK